MNILPQKLIFGSANLLTRYGRKSFFINEYNSMKLMKCARKNGIKTLDISSDYNVFKNNSFNNNYKKWKISFKITKAILSKLYSIKKIEEFIKTILIKFRCKKIEYFLFHHENDLLTKNGRLFFNYLRNLKKKKIVKKIGVSIYDFDKSFKKLKNLPIDVIQAPLNVLDQRIDNSKNLNFLKKKKIEIHVRSIFLQGILVDESLVSPKIKKDKKLKLWFKYLNENNLNPIDEIFNFLKNKKYIDKIIVGARSEKQIKDILSHIKTNKKFNYSVFSNKRKKTIDPRKW